MPLDRELLILPMPLDKELPAELMELPVVPAAELRLLAAEPIELAAELIELPMELREPPRLLSVLPDEDEELSFPSVSSEPMLKLSTVS